LAESNEIRFNGFRLLFKGFPENQIEELVIYAKKNGGISRYEKIDYFFHKIRGESISKDSVQTLAAQFSDIVRQDIIKAEPVKGSLEFLGKNFSKFNFALVSGSDQVELRVVCRERRIDHFFKMILGSPVKKEKNIAKVLESLRWRPDETVYIGDSNNDLEASQDNHIDFIGRNSGLVDWSCLGITRILDLSELEGMLG
jgi:phosphoglycolate phosphatase-like HAD superfamily hydrolase